MSQTKEREQALAESKPVDWIVLSANAFGLFVVILAALHAKAGGIIQEVASSAPSGAIF
ncbi:hypothetical protein HTT03_00775 [Sulfitobacter sp. S0837]|uniref:hypothetical protein n=1 Tax=Sulfitobacter maritimus TaxID=2741719 RepID=UPI001583D16B|nr:hypothetical protein [Sulfitobacter maritimus]NUH63842.1 hypothetical protein [Sulfitobacter maritimus]